MSFETDLEDSMKVIVVGDGNVGKTTMLRRYIKGSYSEQYKKTIGAEFSEKEVYLKDLKQSVTMMLWDTAGQEVFNALTSAYYRDSAACVLAFSTIDRDSFQNVLNWRKKVEAQCGPIVMVLCQTKFDLAKEAAMTPQEADGLAAHMNLPFFRISTKEDFNVVALFEYVAKQVVLKNSGRAQESVIAPTRTVPGEDAGGKSSAPAAGAGAAANATPSSEVPDADAGKKDKKDKKDTKSKDKEKDGNGNNVKPIQMKEIKKKDKKEKKRGTCAAL